MSRILLHVCCAPCGAYVISKLQKDFEITAFYYNPNIYPKSEYQKRLSEFKKYSHKIKLPLIEGKYNNQDWFNLTKGYEKEPERGKRCYLCYRMRLTETARKAQENNFDYFTTDLSISPHKDTTKINQIGQELESQYGIKFLEADFKKANGFKKSIELSRKENFYRQNYCGCLYSQRK